MKFFVACATALLFVACATVKDPQGLALRRGLTPEPPPAVPDSLQADLTVNPREPGVPPFSVRVYARPHKAYRIDATGFPSVIAASYLWQSGRWMWVRHDRREVREGTGDRFDLEETALRLPDVHAILGFIWGQTLPGFEARDSLLAPGPGGEVRWVAHGESWSAVLDPATGLCREAKSAGLRLHYADYRRRDGRWIPGETEVFVEGESVLVLQLRELNDAPRWRKNPFVLAAPAAYQRL